jgi:hypothetical protein
VDNAGRHLDRISECRHPGSIPKLHIKCRFPFRVRQDGARMAKGKKDNWIDIPEEALKGRPIFADRPGDDIVKEILDFVRETNAPHLWRGHTHTTFAKDEEFWYLGEYQLPRGRMAPCPHCSPHHPKYWRKGVIVWFPREKVIRLLGGDCFKTMMGAEAHQAAVKQLGKERRYKAGIAVILNNIDALPETLIAINRSLPIARAVDRFRADLHAGDIGKFVRGLRRHAKEGELYVSEADGAARRYSMIAGYAILSRPKDPALAGRLQETYAALQGLNVGPDPKKYVDNLDADAVEQAAKIISDSIKAVRETFAEIEDRRKFASEQTVATLRSWGTHPGCPFPAYVWRQHLAFRIGKEAPGSLITLNEAFDEPLGQIRHFEKAA